jgi:hypothetical protein
MTTSVASLRTPSHCESRGTSRYRAPTGIHVDADTGGDQATRSAGWPVPFASVLPRKTTKSTPNPRSSRVCAAAQDYQQALPPHRDNRTDGRHRSPAHFYFPACAGNTFASRPPPAHPPPGPAAPRPSMISDDTLRQISREDRAALSRNLVALAEQLPALSAADQRRRRIAVLLTGVSAGLIPWIVLLAITLPRRYSAATRGSTSRPHQDVPTRSSRSRLHCSSSCHSPCGSSQSHTISGTSRCAVRSRRSASSMRHPHCTSCRCSACRGNPRPIDDLGGFRNILSASRDSCPGCGRRCT